MGWASGSQLMNRIITSVKSSGLFEEQRQRVYRDLIVAFQDEDWDTELECLGKDPAFDAALKGLRPKWEI